MDVRIDEAALADLIADSGADLIAEVTPKMHARAVRLCPVDTGELLASIQYHYTRTRGFVTVGTDHWAYPEYGTRSHIIRPRGAGYPLRFFWAKAGRNVAFMSVRHPGTPATPYMRPALDVQI